MSHNRLQQVMAEHLEECLDNREFGFWLYLMTDAIIFALLFATYVSMFRNTANGPEPINLFDLKHVSLETACLLISSVTFGFAWLAAMNKKLPTVMLWLIITLVFGVSFVSLEIAEFAEMIREGAGPQASGYLSSFFTLVATHGIHVSIGMLGILMMVLQVFMKGLTPQVCSRLFRLGLFWHFLDIVWIGIFSVVYLPVFI
ncbi:cytochrome o ubiquinol oxidase subunit III [Endozoicomonas sp. 8E]|uniref:cytochrome o ubiquinol oxidase subunit III n=1 Tax=Endozoicomonas sp. 8E TaxID=3035692 RepID=UPI002938DE5F|nr:cytochrome o ubiquinol oxidase subunit III [Endozoicomonas sp. 8E]WOG25385.1 cytochrome o ubiquinol oxidase subunit III [Endozoicomonas sp. 8E]